MECLWECAGLTFSEFVVSRLVKMVDGFGVKPIAQSRRRGANWPVSLLRGQEEEQLVTGVCLVLGDDACSPEELSAVGVLQTWQMDPCDLLNYLNDTF